MKIAKTKISIISEHIEITPGVCGGKPRIAGHRIRVEDIVIWHEKMGLSPNEIVSHAGFEHYGITYCIKGSRLIGEILRGLIFVWEVLDAEEMTSKVEFL